MSHANRINRFGPGGWALALLFAAGCGDGMTRNPDPVEFTVKVTSAGKPVSGINLGLSPTGVGLPAGIVLKDGTGQGRAIPGEYMYFVAVGDATGTPKEKEAEAVLESIPKKYHEPDPERQITVSGGATIEVQLD
jgi:DUF917 family protein